MLNYVNICTLYGIKSPNYIHLLYSDLLIGLTPKTSCKYLIFMHELKLLLFKIGFHGFL